MFSSYTSVGTSMAWNTEVTSELGTGHMLVCRIAAVLLLFLFQMGELGVHVMTPFGRGTYLLHVRMHRMLHFDASVAFLALI